MKRRNCGALYQPDYRNVHHQYYCQEPACQAVSKKASQKRWLGKPQNRNYHRDKVHVERVRAWGGIYGDWHRVRRRGAVMTINR
jgi:hypothetical protein